MGVVVVVMYCCMQGMQYKCPSYTCVDSKLQTFDYMKHYFSISITPVE